MDSGKLIYKPLYIQVKDIILQRILDGLYKQGEAIPTETKLAEDLGTSISTIRQALAILVSEGILKKKQGRGTFVSEKKIEINFLSWLPEEKHGEKLLSELITRFETKFNNISVNIIPTTYSNSKDDLVNLISNGKAPDVAQIVAHWTSFFASMGALEPLEPLLTEDNLLYRFEEKDILGGQYHDHLYSIAWGLCPLSLLVNINVLQEVGISYIPEKMDLDVFFNICKEISRHSDKKYCYGLSILNDETDFLRIYTFLQAFGGGFVDDNDKVILNSEENVKAFHWLRDFISQVRILDTDIYSIRKRFANDEIAFITDGPWIKYQLEHYTKEPFENNFKVVLNPVIGENNSVSWNYNHALCICSQSKNKAYSAKFIDALTNDEDISNFFYQKSGHLPSNRDYFNNGKYNTEFFNGFIKQLENSKCINAKNPMFEKAMVLCMDAVKKIFFKEVDIKSELDEKEYYLNMLYYDKPNVM